MNVCDECGDDFDPSDSASDKHCQHCLDAGLICVVCGKEVADSENQGDADNPLCEDCAGVVANVEETASDEAIE